MGQGQWVEIEVWGGAEMKEQRYEGVNHDGRCVSRRGGGRNDDGRGP